jgi:uncharacterized protein YjbJ (UPF0337 family)
MPFETDPCRRGIAAMAAMAAMAAAERSARPIIDWSHNRKEDSMNKDRIEGSLAQAKGKVKENVGKATGDAKLQSDGKADQIAGKTQNAIGGI